MKLHTSCTWRFRSSATLKFTTNFLCVEFRWPRGSPVCRDRKKKHQRELDNPAIAPAWRTSDFIEKESISNWSLNLWYTFQWFHFLLEKFWKNKNYLLTTLNKYIYIPFVSCLFLQAKWQPKEPHFIHRWHDLNCEGPPGGRIFGAWMASQWKDLVPTIPTCPKNSSWLSWELTIQLHISNII